MFRELIAVMSGGDIWNKAQVFAMLMANWKKAPDRSLWKPNVLGNKVVVQMKSGKIVEISSPVGVVRFLRDLRQGKLT